MSSTEQVCPVTAFLDKLANTHNIAIVTAATDIIDDYGAVLIAVFVQELDFTNKIKKRLINHNQCISFGFQCVDDPNYTARELVFYANNMFLPLHIQETICLEEYFCPSNNYL